MLEGNNSRIYNGSLHTRKLYLLLNLNKSLKRHSPISAGHIPNTKGKMTDATPTSHYSSICHCHIWQAKEHTRTHTHTHTLTQSAFIIDTSIVKWLLHLSNVIERTYEYLCCMRLFIGRSVPGLDFVLEQDKELVFITKVTWAIITEPIETIPLMSEGIKQSIEPSLL